jgi:Conserved region in glutamate synthase
MSSAYTRYQLEGVPAPDLFPVPPRFRVRVRKLSLARLLLRELLEYRANPGVVLSRPCVYGVFSGPLGGFAPRERLCVGCLRCTVEYPEVVQIHPHAERERLGSACLGPDDVDSILYESRTGRVPVRGAGYRGRFGGEGWDGIWTDMSEIVRPTRDGIHGRETIGTDVDVGVFPPWLRFDAAAEPQGPVPRFFTIQLPLLFDLPPRSAESPELLHALADAALRLDTLALISARRAVDLALRGPHVVPVLSPHEWGAVNDLDSRSRMLELDGWDPVRFAETVRRFPGSLVAVRVPADADVLPIVREGARVVHLVADYRGRAGAGFFGDAIRSAHRQLVDAGLREEVTLLGSGGIARAEHLAKAIICGLDAGALDVVPCIALQGRFEGDARDSGSCRVELPRFDPRWAAQRIVNLAASWRDQLLEVLGAMGLREVRRLRGELGRALFQSELEREAFAGIRGYEPRA